MPLRFPCASLDLHKYAVTCKRRFCANILACTNRMWAIRHRLVLVRELAERNHDGGIKIVQKEQNISGKHVKL